MNSKHRTRAAHAKSSQPLKMPPSQQRRLNELIDRSKTAAGLTVREINELERLLEHVDRSSFWMLARRVSAALGTGQEVTPREE